MTEGPSASDLGTNQIIVMTGATSGLGAQALKRFVAEPGTLIIVGARSAWSVPHGAETLPLDLASLASVRAFADAVKRRLGETLIDRLVLNAGGQFEDVQQRSAEGFELTFAVNHLAHYLLARLLLPNIATGGRLEFTTSDTHDPATIGAGPKTFDVQAWAGGQGSGTRAYAASKLCNLLTARSFAALAEVQERHIQVIAYNPGLTLGTGLFRTAPQWVQRTMTGGLVRGLLGFLSRFKPAFYPGTPERGGEALAQLVLGAVTPPPGRVYASLVRGRITYPDPSELARDDEARDRLWRESAAMVGLP
jgi:NAD(P)-dependent dehydrogenase (short-subunit alcohol dehydrogenase family)